MKPKMIMAVAMAGVLTSAGLVSPLAWAHDGPAHHGREAREPRTATRQGSPAKVALTDLELLDQDGRRVRFKSDVIGDRLVVITSFYTTCGLICPVLGALFASLQGQLGSRLGRDVTLVSISVDPVTDIPARLKEYAERYRAKPGWTLLTGSKQDVDEVLRGIGAYTPDFTDHPNMILVGDPRHGGWTRFYDFPAPQRILDRLEALRTARLARAK